jgi:membrane-associated phospholipid phosphatase
MVAYGVAAVAIGAISATRIYLQAHYPIDVLGGWIAGGALLAILVAIHVLRVDERAHERDRARGRPAQRRVAVPRRRSAPAAEPNEPVEG